MASVYEQITKAVHYNLGHGATHLLLTRDYRDELYRALQTTDLVRLVMPRVEMFMGLELVNIEGEKQFMVVKRLD